MSSTFLRVVYTGIPELDGQIVQFREAEDDKHSIVAFQVGILYVVPDENLKLLEETEMSKGDLVVLLNSRDVDLESGYVEEVKANGKMVRARLRSDNRVLSASSDNFRYDKVGYESFFKDVIYFWEPVYRIGTDLAVPISKSTDGNGYVKVVKRDGSVEVVRGTDLVSVRETEFQLFDPVFWLAGKKNKIKGRIVKFTTGEDSHPICQTWDNPTSMAIARSSLYIDENWIIRRLKRIIEKQRDIEHQEMFAIANKIEERRESVREEKINIYANLHSTIESPETEIALNKIVELDKMIEDAAQAASDTIKSDSNTSETMTREAPHSNHYEGKIEPIDLIDAQDLNFYEGNIIKYVVRHSRKDGLKDLEKALFYLKRLIKTTYGDQDA